MTFVLVDRNAEKGWLEGRIRERDGIKISIDRSSTALKALNIIERFVGLPSQPVKVVIMASPSSPTPQQFYNLDRSSPDFPRQLDDILHDQEHEQCVLDLQDDDLMRLVDYLYEVRRC